VVGCSPQGRGLPDGCEAPAALKEVVALGQLRHAKGAEPVDLGTLALDSEDNVAQAALACQTEKDDRFKCAPARQCLPRPAARRVHLVHLPPPTGPLTR
jgi:hypothetical protein